jgi:hypothetical protein
MDSEGPVTAEVSPADNIELIISLLSCNTRQGVVLLFSRIAFERSESHRAQSDPGDPAHPGWRLVMIQG